MADNKRRLNLRQPGQEDKFNETVSNDYIRQPKKDNDNFNQPVNKKQNNNDDEIYDNYTREAVITGEDGQLADDIAEKVLSEKEQETKKILTYLKTTFLGQILYEQDENGDYIPGFYEIEDGTLERRFIPDRHSEEHKEVETITDVGFDGNHIYIQDNEVDRYRLNDPIRDPRIKKGLPPLNVTADDVEKLGKQVANRMGRAWNPSAPIMDVEIGHLRSNFMDGSVSPYGVTMAIRVSRASLALRNLADMADEEVEQLLATFMRCGLNLLISGPTGTGKSIPHSEKLPTPYGIKNHGDLKVGDYVYGRDGKPTEVLEVYPQGKLDVYEVELTDGRVVRSSGDHLWRVKKPNWKEWKDLTLLEMLDDGVVKELSNNRVSYQYKIPVNEAVTKEEKEYKVPPYVMGAFIGDGSLTSKALVLNSDDDFIAQKVGELLGSKDTVRLKDSFKWVYRISDTYREDNQVGNHIKNYQTDMVIPEGLVGRCDTRYIPREYLEGSLEQRYELLQGLMDTDGAISPESAKYNVYYRTVSKKLAQDVAELGRSLGFNMSISNTYGNYNKGKGSKAYTVNFNISSEQKEGIFTLPRKVERVNASKDIVKRKVYTHVSIKSITKLDYQEEMQCIRVDNKENLYLVGDFVVTHNTEMQQRLKQVNTGYIE